MSLKRGRLLGGQYRIEGPIDGGAMGSVYKAFDKLGQPVAIKENKNSSSPIGRKAFENEAKTLLKMRHPAIVGGRQYIEDKREQYIVMDFIDGITLEKFAQTQALDVDRVLDWTEDLLEGLNFIHSQGL